MKYLIAKHIKILASCLVNYNHTWDIIPDMLRLSEEKPFLDHFTIEGLAQLKRVTSLLEMVEKDLKTSEKDKIILKKPVKAVLKSDKPLIQLFITGEKLQKSVSNLTGKEIKTEETLLPIIIGLKEDVTSVVDRIEKEKKNITPKEHSIIRDIGSEMRVYPSRILAFFQLKKTAKVKKQIFLDLDGVLTDFDSAVRELGPEASEGLAEDAEKEKKQVMWDKIEDAGINFWANMKWLPDGKKVWDIVKDKNPILLTAPGLYNFARGGKELWVKEHLPGVQLYFENAKENYAEMDTILIDDRADNINGFIEAGGEGIVYESPEQTQEELDKLLN